MPASLESFRTLCARLPGATRDVKWGADEVYSVGAKMFAVFWIEGGRARTVSFKCAGERFLELTDVPGIVPAPYLARAHWVQLREPNALPAVRMAALLRDSHRLVLAGLPRKTQVAIIAAHAAATPARRPSKRRRAAKTT